MDKKGFLLGEETLKVILAVIAICFLVFLLFALYFATSGDEEKEQAQATLTNSTGSVKFMVERVRSGVSPEEKGLINSPKGWNIFTFVGEDKKPNFCAGENCICICDEVWVDNFLGIVNDRQLKECDEKGVCLVISDLQNKKLNVEIKVGTPITVKKIAQLISIELT